MIKKLIFIFMALLYSTSQVMALQCALECVPKNSSKVGGPVAMDHSCCHDKKTTAKHKSKSDKSKQCFHEVLGTQFSSQDHVKLSLVSERVIFLQQLAIVERVATPMLFANYRYHTKIPDRSYLNFKSRLDLYILKDQFLI